MSAEPAVCVVGAGSWGTAFAAVTAGKGIDTVIWARREELADAISTRHENPDYLPGIDLPPGLMATHDLEKALSGSSVAVMSVRVMFLETQLDAAMTSERSEIRFMREFLNNFGGVELIAKEVHSRADLAKFLEYSPSDESIQALHIVSHGVDARREPCIVLTDDEVLDLNHHDVRGLLQDLRVEVIYLSCCQLGRDTVVMQRLLEASGAVALFSYSRDVDDYQAFITETLFYHLAYGYVRGARSDLVLEEVYEKLKFSLDYLGIDGSRHPLSRPAPRCCIRLARRSGIAVGIATRYRFRHVQEYQETSSRRRTGHRR